MSRQLGEPLSCAGILFAIRLIEVLSHILKAISVDDRHADVLPVVHLNSRAILYTA
jgi:hypothetical protein